MPIREPFDGDHKTEWGRGCTCSYETSWGLHPMRTERVVNPDCRVHGTGLRAAQIGRMAEQLRLASFRGLNDTAAVESLLRSCGQTWRKDA